MVTETTGRNAVMFQVNRNGELERISMTAAASAANI